MPSARTILITGKGGVGKTSVAAATARRCAASGLRTLILSTDPAHSLSESLERELGPEPTDAGQNLWGQEVQAQREMERHWAGVQSWLGGLLLERGVGRIAAEELTVPPGMDELFSLLRLQEAHRSGEWEAIVVDCAPTGETLRLLSFPDVARWWLDKVFPAEGRLMAAARPLTRSLLDIPFPDERVFADLKRLSENLIDMNEILRDHQRSTIRLVLNPDRMVIGEAMRMFTYLNLYGYVTDAVIVNRVFPAEVGSYFDRWRAVQSSMLELIDSAFSPVPVLRAPYFDSEVIGPEMLDQLADTVYGGGVDAAAVLYEGVAHQLSVTGDEARMRIALPFAAKGSISLKKVGQELIVGVDGQKRTIVLPGALASFQPLEASFNDGALEIRFSPAVADRV